MCSGLGSATHPTLAALAMSSGYGNRHSYAGRSLHDGHVPHETLLPLEPKPEHNRRFASTASNCMLVVFDLAEDR